MFGVAVRGRAAQGRGTHGVGRAKHCGAAGHWRDESYKHSTNIKSVTCWSSESRACLLKGEGGVAGETYCQLGKAGREGGSRWADGWTGCGRRQEVSAPAARAAGVSWACLPPP